MLILSRRVNESIIVNGDITFTILAIRGNQIRIGIKAPPEVTIVRDELLDRERSSEGIS